jgi:hypothetical protein
MSLRYATASDSKPKRRRCVETLKTGVNEIHRPLYTPQPSHAMIPSPTVRTRHPLAFDKDAKLTPPLRCSRPLAAFRIHHFTAHPPRLVGRLEARPKTLERVPRRSWRREESVGSRGPVRSMEGKAVRVCSFSRTGFWRCHHADTL